MRICFLSRRYWPAVSGMSVYAENLLRQLVAMGHDVTMISQYRGDPEGRGVYGGGPPPEVPGVRVIGLRSRGEEAAANGATADFERDTDEMTETVLAEASTAPFDVVHAQYAYPTGLAALRAARELGVPSVVSIQGGDGHWVGLCCETHRLAMAEVLEGAGRLLIGSRSFAEEVAANHGTAPGRFTVVPGATDTERFRPGGAILPPDGPPRLLYHGRVDLRKGLGELVEAAAILKAEGRDFRLRVSGIGPDLAETERRVAHAGLADRVAFTGYTGYADAPEVYRDADIFVSPTYSEGFSNTILEAMATGLAIVSTDTVGVVDCLSDGRNGLLVPVGKPAPLAEAIARLLDDQPLARRLAETGLADVRHNYAWPVLARRIVEAYRTTPAHTAGTRAYWPGLETADPGCRFRAAPHLL
jgi:glycosyltransferase involved in cell wall biosynthesis